MVFKAEAEKIQYVKDAEAHCESLYLHGIGLSSQRQVIAKEMKKCVQSSVTEKVSEKDIMKLMLMTLYLDTISTVAETKDNETSFLGHGGAGQLSQLRKQINEI